MVDGRGEKFSLPAVKKGFFLANGERDPLLPLVSFGGKEEIKGHSKKTDWSYPLFPPSPSCFQKKEAGERPGGNVSRITEAGA